MRIAQLLLGLLVVGLESVLAVQRDNFRTCSQVAYCRYEILFFRLNMNNALNIILKLNPRMS